MIKILSVIGARPQIIKSAAMSRAVRTAFKNKIKEIIVHTGQHYDQNMSSVFFEEMLIPRPDYNLDVRSGAHGKQTAMMMTGIEEIFLKEKPDCVVVYGDTNSTLAAAVAASKLHVPVVHIEAGLRSFNKKMPEEINRILCDHVSTLLFSPSEAGFINLMKEGFPEGSRPPFTIDNPKIFHCGDVMYDNSLHFSAIAETRTDIVKRLDLEKNKYVLATIHRDYNTDIPERLNSIFSAMDKISKVNKIPFVIPLHPRTAKLIETNLLPETLIALKGNSLLQIIPPVSFLEMVSLEKNSMMIMTDSGGVQKESFFFRKPCIILRSETEWVELVENGNAIVADAGGEKIIDAFNRFSDKVDFTFPRFYGDGRAAEFICSEIFKAFDK